MHNKNLNPGMEEIKEAIFCAIEIYQVKGEPVPEPVNRTQREDLI